MKDNVNELSCFLRCKFARQHTAEERIARRSVSARGVRVRISCARVCVCARARTCRDRSGALIQFVGHKVQCSVYHPSSVAARDLGTTRARFKTSVATSNNKSRMLCRVGVLFLVHKL